jgi:hypothetical protein
MNYLLEHGDTNSSLSDNVSFPSDFNIDSHSERTSSQS